MAEPQQQNKPITFGKWVFDKRNAKGMTQDELARKVKRSKSYISAIEREISHSTHGHDPRPRPETVDLIARALGEDPAIPRSILGYMPDTYTGGNPFLISEDGAAPQLVTSHIARIDVQQTVAMLRDEACRYEYIAKHLRDTADEIAAKHRLN